MNQLTALNRYGCVIFALVLLLTGPRLFAAIYIGQVGHDKIQLHMQQTTTVHPFPVTLYLNQGKAKKISAVIDKTGLFHFVAANHSLYFSAAQNTENTLIILNYQGKSVYAPLIKIKKQLSMKRFKQITCTKTNVKFDASQIYILYLNHNKPFAISYYINRGKPAYNSCQYIATGQIKRKGKGYMMYSHYQGFDEKTDGPKDKPVKLYLKKQTLGYQVELKQAMAVSEAICGQNVFLPESIIFKKTDQGYMCH